MCRQGSESNAIISSFVRVFPSFQLSHISLVQPRRVCSSKRAAGVENTFGKDVDTHKKVCDIHRLHLCIPVCAFPETQSGWGVCVRGRGAKRKRGCAHTKTQQRRGGAVCSFRMPPPTQSDGGYQHTWQPAALEQRQGTLSHFVLLL